MDAHEGARSESGKSVVVATHGYCFDGLCSAVMFTRLLRHVDRGPLRFRYASCAYGPGQNGVDPKVLAGDVNAILDYRFSPAPQLTWYFDHHVSAFQGGDREAYEVRTHVPAPDRRFFHDGTYGSCTKLIADVGARDFGLDPAATASLVRWADMIDSASFPTAEFAVERKEPVLQLMTVVEHGGDDAFLARMVPRLLTESIEDVARSPEVVAAYAPLGAQNELFVTMVRAAAREKGGVVLVDLSDRLIDVATKFVTYALFPESAYSVVVSRSKSKCKISIGYNPWSPTPRRHDIAKICERWGGGGHPVVGGITLPEGDVAKTQEIARTIAEELST
ncbi:MAG: hypothetical protein ACLQVI_34525 [Polyangiaceae bacterium]